MSVIERNIKVEYRLQVFFTEGVFKPANGLLKDLLCSDPDRESHKVLIVLDEALVRMSSSILKTIQDYFESCSEGVTLVCAPMLIEGGEDSKNNFHYVTEIQKKIEQHGVCRHSYVIAVGGGAVLDVVGLAAATSHRGVRHIRIPTTTLSQDDSGVGIKNGINAFGKKNFIGTFAPPFAVINDHLLLESLPDRHKRAGYSEAIKVALIRDEEFFNWIERNATALKDFKDEPLKELIYRSAALHLKHISTSGDPFEFGSARPLDFGHWAAHKLEALSHYRLAHGEAVAVGIALDVVYSELMGYLDTSSTERILSLFSSLGFDLFCSELFHVDAQGQLDLVNGLEEFREHLGGRLNITLLQGIGKGFEVHEMDYVKVARSIHILKERFGDEINPSGELAAGVA